MGNYSMLYHFDVKLELTFCFYTSKFYIFYTVVPPFCVSLKEESAMIRSEDPHRSPPSSSFVSLLNGRVSVVEASPDVLRCGKRSWSCFLFGSVCPPPNPNSQEVVGDLTLVVKQVFRLGAVGVAWHEKKRKA